jgi:UDPglucose 6-dehydrogenase
MHGSETKLLQAVMDINRNQRRRAVMTMRDQLGSLNDKLIGILGLSFKPNTDDIREAAALDIIHLLEVEGAKVKAYDPQAMEACRKVLKNTILCEDPYQVADGVDALVLATEWNEFKQLDFKRIKGLMKQPIILDGRNLWDAEHLRSLGFTYSGIGRGNLK